MDMSAKQRAERIKGSIPIINVLEDYGYAVRSDADNREQQFSCDLHGDGSDLKPSARAYPESNSWYCFGCGRSRDAIATVQEKEGVSFGKACFILEKKFGLKVFESNFDNKVDFGLTFEDTSKLTFDRESNRVREILLSTTHDKTLSLDDGLIYWEAFDRISWSRQKDILSERDAVKTLGSLRKKIIKAIT
jgi:hypothetical protein